MAKNKRLVQVINPKTRMYQLIDKKEGRIIQQRLAPWVYIELVGEDIENVRPKIKKEKTMHQINLNQIKPCPFCGTCSTTIEKSKWDEIYRIRCTNCSIRTARCYGLENALRCWNRRPQELDKNGTLKSCCDAPQDDLPEYRT